MSAGTGDYERLFEIVGGARELSGDALEAFMAEACGDDAALSARVLELLAAGFDDARDDAFSEPAVDAARRALDELAEAGATTWRPERIADYTIVRLIGQGGMGVVYEAEQASPRRRVAIKLLHPMSATDERLRRLRHEAELLGRLQHPGIAHVIEAGTYDVGRGPQPYFAMEFIEGLDIRTHCERNRLDRAARVELLARVADAVQYAHEHGVIHRDLKPDNVLIDTHGNPRVLDFGIARATDGMSTALSSLGAEDGRLLGTLAYMAPELLARAPDAARPQLDVYGLGVLAFEVLVGRQPWELGALSFSRAVALLATRDAPRASRFDPTLRGDVETILGKALETDRSRRYGSAAALAADLRRHLAHRPIDARAPSGADLVRKFTRRHRGLVAGAVATGLSLVAGAVVALVLARDAQQQRDRAAASELRALNGLHQSAQVLIDSGQPGEALRQLRLVPEQARGVAWRLLRGALPVILEEPPGDWFFVDDERVVGSWRARAEEPPGAPAHLALVSLSEGRRLRELSLGEARLRVLGAVPAGLAVLARDGEHGVEEYLLADLDRETILERGPAFAADGAAPYPSGHRLAGQLYASRMLRVPQVSDDGRTRLWYVSADVAEIRREGAVIHTVRDLGCPESVQLGPDGRAIAVNRRDEVTVIDLASGVTSFRVPADLAAGGASGFPVCGGVLLRSVHEAESFSTPSWRRFALTPGAALLEPREPFATAFRAQTAGRHQVSHPRDGRFVATAYAAGDTTSGALGDTVGGAPLPFAVLSGRPDGTRGWLDFPREPGAAVRVSPSGERLMVVGFTAPPRIVELDPRDREPDFAPRVLTLRGHGDEAPRSGWIYHVAVSNDGSLIASAAPWDALIRLWDTRTGELLGGLRRDSSRARPDEPGSWDALMAFDADDERLLVTTPFDGRGLCLVEWHLPSGATRVIGSPLPEDASHLALLDRVVETLRPGPRARLGQRAQLAGERALVAFHPPTPGLRNAPPPPRGERWDYASGRGATQAGLSVHPTRPRVAVVEAVGAHGERDAGLLLVNDTRAGEPLLQRELGGRPWCVAYSPDGSALAVGTHEGRVLLLETGQYTQQLAWQAHEDYVYSLAWTPDGTRLVSVSGDETVRIWDTRTRVATRSERDRWQALRARMAARADLVEAVSELVGAERQAARAELIRRASR